MSRRVLTATLAAGLVLALGGCGGSGPAHTSSRRTASSTTTTVSTKTSAPLTTASSTAATTSTTSSTTTTVPPPRPHPPLLLGQIPDRLPTHRHVVALTFDAGADNAGAPKILAALAHAHASGTFFMTGRWAELYPGWARRIAARYPIGNHTFDHTNLLQLPAPGVSHEVEAASAAIARATGRPPARLFRFPYGASSDATLRLVNHLGYAAVGWTVDTLGWEGTSMGQSVGSVIARALGHLGPGEIILMHVGANPTDHSTLDADALPAILRAIRARGYTFATVPEYMGVPGAGAGRG